jgi:uncharacterized membrane protein YdjX (TVP38/TMEM64 family)
MKALIKVALVLVLVFAATFVVIKFTGLITLDDIKAGLQAAHGLSPWWLSALVVSLLLADLLIAMPTLTVILLSGYFLGPIWGAVAALSGLTLAGLGGYGLGRCYGERLLCWLVRDELQREQAKDSFQSHGAAMILLARALPILPEVSACLAGLTGMTLTRFLLAWMASAIPYVLIATYAGSVSNVAQPQPAIFTAIGLSALFWCAWLFYAKRHPACSFFAQRPLG